MNQYTRYEIELHEVGRKLQNSLPYYMGFQIQQLEAFTGFSWGTVCSALDGLEAKGKLVCQRTKSGNRKHGSIRFKGRIPRRKSA